MRFRSCFSGRVFLGLALLLGMGIAPAKLVPLDQGKVSVDVPDDWTVQTSDQPEQLLKASDKDGARTVIISVVNLSSNHFPSQAEEDAVVANLTQNGELVVNRVKGKLNQIQCRFVTTTHVLKTETYNSLTAIVAANRKHYILTQVLRNGNPLQDKMLRDVFASFKFASRPNVPYAGSNSTLALIETMSDSFEDATGLPFSVAEWGVTLAILAGIFWYLRQRSPPPDSPLLR